MTLRRMTESSSISPQTPPSKHFTASPPPSKEPPSYKPSAQRAMPSVSTTCIIPSSSSSQTSTSEPVPSVPPHPSSNAHVKSRSSPRQTRWISPTSNATFSPISAPIKGSPPCKQTSPRTFLSRTPSTLALALPQRASQTLPSSNASAHGLCAPTSPPCQARIHSNLSPFLVTLLPSLLWKIHLTMMMTRVTRTRLTTILLLVLPRPLFIPTIHIIHVIHITTIIMHSVMVHGVQM